MATSTAPAFVDALVVALAARTGLAGVRVKYGPPFPDPGRESIAVTGWNGDQEWASLGRLAQEEVYTAEGMFLVVPGGEPGEGARRDPGAPARPPRRAQLGREP